MRFGISFFATGTALDPASMARMAEGRFFESLWPPELRHVPISRRTLEQRAAFVESLTP